MPRRREVLSYDKQLILGKNARPKLRFGPRKVKFSQPDRIRLYVHIFLGVQVLLPDISNCRSESGPHVDR